MHCHNHHLHCTKCCDGFFFLKENGWSVKTALFGRPHIKSHYFLTEYTEKGVLWNQIGFCGTCIIQSENLEVALCQLREFGEGLFVKKANIAEIA